MAKKASSGTTVQLLNRDIWEGYEAITLLTQRGWGDAQVALSLGRTGRKLRDARDVLEETRQMLIKKFGKKQENGGYDLTDQVGFMDAWRVLMMTEASLEVFPVSLTAVASREKACETCHRGPLNDIPAVSLDVLVHIGAVREDG